MINRFWVTEHNAFSLFEQPCAACRRIACADTGSRATVRIANVAGAGGHSRQGAGRSRPHGQRDQRRQRCDDRRDQSHLARRCAAYRSGARHQRVGRAWCDDDGPPARRQYRADAGADRRRSRQRSRERQRRFRLRHVCAGGDRADRGAARPAKRALWIGCHRRRHQHHHPQGQRPRACRCRH